MKPGERSIPQAGTSRPSFLDSPKINIISRMEHGFRFGRTHARELIESQSLSAKSAARIWKARKSVPNTAPDITDFSLKIPTAINLKSAAGSNQTSPNKRSHLAMHEPKIVLQPRKRIRYLKLIAL